MLCHVCIYLCMYVSMYVCIYVYICMYACTHVCMYVCMHIFMYVCMHNFMYVCMYVLNYILCIICVNVCTCISAQNSFWKCPAETSGQNNSWPSSCRFCPLGNDCSWKIINLIVRLLFLFCCIFLITNQTICPVKCNFVRTEAKCTENCQLLDVISSTAFMYFYMCVLWTNIIY